MVKMVVSSFYNALINDEDAVYASTMLEIERIRKKGIVFSVCTNRNYQEVLEYNKDFPFLDYIIALNGSYIYDVEKGRCISKNKITVANLKKINTFFKDYPVIYYTGDNIYTNSDDLGDLDVYKVEIEVDDKNKVEELLKKIRGNFSYIKIHDKTYLEITSAKSDMFTGVDQIGLKNSINLNDIVVVCANESDYPLVRNIKHSFIVKNGSDILKKATRRRTSTNIDKGVEKVLNKI